MTNTPPPRLHIGFKNTVTLIAQPDGPFTGWVLGGCVGGGHKTPVRFLRAVACNSMWVGILNNNKWSSSFLSHWKMEDWNFLRTSSARFWQVLARFSRWNYEKFCTYIFAFFWKDIEGDARLESGTSAPEVWCAIPMSCKKWKLAVEGFFHKMCSAFLILLLCTVT